MKKSRYYFDIKAVSDFAALCGRFAGKPLQSPYRSTVPLLSLVYHSQPQWNSLLESLAAPADASIHFEYCVGSPKPGGNPSQTDALIKSESTVWAFEAKWTEPRYGTVAERISEPEADGADPRVTANGWLQHLQPFATRRLHIDDFVDVVYQVLHRTASACAVAIAHQRQPQLVYLHFHPSPLNNSATIQQYASDLERLYMLLGKPAELMLFAVEMPLHFTPAFETIKDLDKGSPATSALVLKGIA